LLVHAGLAAAVLAAFALAPSPARAADATRLGVDAEYNHYTNVNRAALGGEEQSDDSVGAKPMPRAASCCPTAAASWSAAG
jgi:hypothetical protein